MFAKESEVGYVKDLLVSQIWFFVLKKGTATQNPDRLFIYLLQVLFLWGWTPSVGNIDTIIQPISKVGKMLVVPTNTAQTAVHGYSCKLSILGQVSKLQEQNYK